MKKENLQFKGKNGFKFLVVVFSFSILLFNLAPVSADEPGDNDFVYLFHLYYDNGQLFADKDFEFKYDVIPEEFVLETYNTLFPFKGEIINLKNEVATQFLFDPRRGNPDFLKGKISVKAPYIADGQKVVFYDAQAKPLLTVFVSESSFCDDDGVCNSDRGEDLQTCPNDCKTLPTANGQQPTTDGSGQGGILMAAIYVLITAGAALGGWYGWKRWKKVKNVGENEFIPPVNRDTNSSQSTFNDKSRL